MEAKEDNYGWTCLHVASYHGHLAICRLLIDKGAQLDAMSAGVLTPLHWAVTTDNLRLVRLLCDHGADIEAKDSNGWTPLQSAAYNGLISIMKELVEERNADINARDGVGTTALRWAREEDNPDVAAFLIAHGAIDEGNDEQQDNLF